MSGLLGLITSLGILAVLGIYLILQQRRKGKAFYTNPEELNLNRRLGVHGMNLVDIGYQYQFQGSCAVCGQHRVFVLNVPPDDFVAHYYHLKQEMNWVCSKCWVDAKVHDPDQQNLRKQRQEADDRGVRGSTTPLWVLQQQQYQKTAERLTRSGATMSQQSEQGSILSKRQRYLICPNCHTQMPADLDECPSCSFALTPFKETKYWCWTCLTHIYGYEIDIFMSQTLQWITTPGIFWSRRADGKLIPLCPYCQNSLFNQPFWSIFVGWMKFPLMIAIFACIWVLAIYLIWGYV